MRISSLKSIFLVGCLFYSVFVFSDTKAETSTLLNIIKTTTLTGQDATDFVKVFGNEFTGTSQFHFSCQNGSCTIFAATAGLSGTIPEELLKGRNSAKFVSSDEKFTLNCGRTTIAFCNISQRDALLP